MNDICDVKKCTGCAACYSICPKNSITFVSDNEGFLVPHIDSSTCVRCGLCKKVCPVREETQRFIKDSTNEPGTYAVIAFDEHMLAKSSSGGAFGILAQIVLQQGGVVFGAAYDSMFRVSQVMIDDSDQMTVLHGSKYVQSDVGDSFKKAKSELDKGRVVLYSGTPCQIAGINSYLGKTYQNLITVDILCHGVPNYELFSKYLSYMEHKHKAKIISYSFRDKSKWGWGNWGSVYLSNSTHNKKKLFFPVDCDYFYSLYFKENCYRESCYICPFAKIPRQGDFTIGDFWGAEELLKNVSIKKGVSLLLVNSQHAENLLTIIRQKARLIPCNFESVLNNNGTILHPTTRPESRSTFYSNVDQLGFENAASACCKLRYFVPIISRYLPMWLKRFVKNSTNRFRQEPY